MKHLWILLLCQGLAAQVNLNYRNNQTPEYAEVIEFYRQLAAGDTRAALFEMGPTDSGKPLHLFVVSQQGVAEDARLADLRQGKTVLLVNNGIHPGESCGIDASLKWSSQLLKGDIPEDVLIAIIPVYNLGGALNRGGYSRANQLGPEEHGFRGNARNLDLNRDFIKADALNTLSFYAIFQALQPHVFVDTHTSNGADYQYTMTLLSTQKDKLNPVLAELLKDDLEPFLYREMKTRNWEMTPYVNVFGSTPDKGFSAFMDSPRYATGYTALFNTIGFTTEAHMLKPYADRVEATYQFLESLMKYIKVNSAKLRELKEEAELADAVSSQFAIDWKLDSSIVDRRHFMGFEYEYQPSEIGNYQRLKYLSDKPKTFDLPYYPAYKASISVDRPKYYVLPQAWRHVVQRLQYNGVELVPLKRDSLISGYQYRVESADFVDRPYEGHFPVRQLSLKEEAVQRQFHKGDYLVPMDRSRQRFITAVLEPAAIDSYLRWNFFNEIFQQKEYFSAYVFEDTALRLLEEDEKLRQEFETWARENPEQLENPYSTLDFIYKRTKYYEKEHLRYPVMRVE